LKSQISSILSRLGLLAFLHFPKMEFFKTEPPSTGIFQYTINLKIYIRHYDDVKCYLLSSPESTVCRINSATVSTNNPGLDIITSKLKNIYKLRQQGLLTVSRENSKFIAHLEIKGISRGFFRFDQLDLIKMIGGIQDLI
jgi:hypothetical protein